MGERWSHLGGSLICDVVRTFTSSMTTARTNVRLSWRPPSAELELSQSSMSAECTTGEVLAAGATAGCGRGGGCASMMVVGLTARLRASPDPRSGALGAALTATPLSWPRAGTVGGTRAACEYGRGALAAAATRCAAAPTRTPSSGGACGVVAASGEELGAGTAASRCVVATAGAADGSDEARSAGRTGACRGEI